MSPEFPVRIRAADVDACRGWRPSAPTSMVFPRSGCFLASRAMKWQTHGCGRSHTTARLGRHGRDGIVGTGIEETFGTVGRRRRSSFQLGINGRTSRNSSRSSSSSEAFPCLIQLYGWATLLGGAVHVCELNIAEYTNMALVAIGLPQHAYVIFKRAEPQVRTIPLSNKVVRLYLGLELTEFPLRGSMLPAFGCLKLPCVSGNSTERRSGDPPPYK